MGANSWVIFWLLFMAGALVHGDAKSGGRGIVIKMAFGEDSEEGRRDIQWWIPSKGLVFAAKDWSNHDGTIKLTTVSFAWAKPGSSAKNFVALTTLRSDWAIITFDRPLDSSISPAEGILGRKIRYFDFPSGLRYRFNTTD